MGRYTFLLEASDPDGIMNVMLPDRDAFSNFTLWKTGPYIFGHFEGGEQDKERMLRKLKMLPDCCKLLCLPGEMRVMYENRGCVRSDKAGLSHRVFAAKLKPGCADEYERRHSEIPPLPADREDYESNWGIWFGDGHIFGYCECDPALRREPTEEEQYAAVQWETAQLAIMDWLTDDMDWLTGQRHETVQRLL